ncbi:MAG: hypothetical protein U0X73_17745 [Thermoanaerobaculia bacterium]
MSQERPRVPIAKLPLVYEMTGMDEVEVRAGLRFPGADGVDCELDLYLPAAAQGGAPPPAVVIVGGYPDPGLERRLGCRFMDMGWSTGWARLLATCGIAAVTYANRDPAADLVALLDHLRRTGERLGIDARRVGLWASSGSAPLALSQLMNDADRGLRCAALGYGYTLDLEGGSEVAEAARTFGFAYPAAGRSVADLSPDVPLFLARAGQDEMPGLNRSLDRFVARALESNLPVALVNHPTGPHAFDLVDPSSASRAIVREILAFLRLHLDAAPG